MINHTRFMTTSAFGALLIAGALAAPVAAQAGQVTLQSVDGSVNLSGDFIGFEDNLYIVSTTLGEMRVSADVVTCSGADCPVLVSTLAAPADARFALAGSDTVGEGLMPLLLEGWAASLDAEATSSATGQGSQVSVNLTGDQGFGDPLSDVTVTSTSSGDAFFALLRGEAEFGMASRQINPSEARALFDAGLGDLTDPALEHIIAVDSLVTIVHPDNPVQILNIDELRGIFSGRLTNWQQVGGPNAPINVYDRDVSSGTRSAFMSPLFDTAPNQLRSATITDGNREMADAVAADPNAIGFVGYAFQRDARSMPLENECGMTIEPDSFSARTEEYPLQRRLYLYNTAAGTTPTSQEFLDYIQSSDADEMIEKSGFISLGIDSRAQDLDSPRGQALLERVNEPFRRSQMSDMRDSMAGFERLSSTFRFDTGSARLDRRAPLDMARLVTYLETMPAGTQVRVVGFTDSVGSLRNNAALSQRRAEQVAEAISAFSGDRLAGIEITHTGFGEIAPTACNINDTGRQINRRVEVWIAAPDAT